MNAIDAALEANARSLVVLPAEFYSLRGAARIRLAEELVAAACLQAGRSREADRYVAKLVARGYRQSPRIPTEPAPRARIRRVAVACCYFNPAGFRNRLRNYQRFAWSLQRQGAELYTAELVLDGDRPAIEGAGVFRFHGTRRRNAVWQKERLYNLLLERIPAAVDAIVFADVDLVWLADDWLEETRQALETFPLVQPFSYVRRLNEAGDRSDRRAGLGYAYANGLPYEQPFLAFPGYAWAGRRSFWNRCGWFDRMITGSGDCAFVEAILGDALPRDYASRLAPVPRSLDRARAEWARGAYAEARRNVCGISAEVAHCWHGDDVDRCYVRRHRALVEHSFTLDEIEIDSEGLLAWRNPLSTLAVRMRRYFHARREDGVS